MLQGLLKSVLAGGSITNQFYEIEVTLVSQILGGSHRKGLDTCGWGIH